MLYYLNGMRYQALNAIARSSPNYAVIEPLGKQLLLSSIEDVYNIIEACGYINIEEHQFDVKAKLEWTDINVKQKKWRQEHRLTFMDKQRGDRLRRDLIKDGLSAENSKEMQERMKIQQEA